MSKSFFKGAVTALPIIFGYFFIGFAAGALAARVGMSVLEVSLLSLLVFAGSAQFIFAPLYAGSAIVLIFTIFLLNLRHFLYSLAFLPYVRRLSIKSRFFIGAQLTDETFGFATSFLKSPLEKPYWMFGLNLSSYLSWVSGNTAGAWIGSNIESANIFGVEFGFAAMFAGLLTMQFINAKKLFSLIAVIILAAIVMVTLEVLYPNPANIVITTVFVATLGMFLEGFLQKKEDELKN